MKLTALPFALLALCAAWQANAEHTPAQIEQTGKAAERYFQDHPEVLGETIATWLAEHPEFLVAAGENLRQRQQVAQQQGQVQAVLHQRGALLAAGKVENGPRDAKVAAIVFADETDPQYQTTKTMVESVAPSNPDIRFIYKFVKARSDTLTASEQQANVDLAGKVALSALPAIVVMPQEKDPEIRRVTVLNGNTSSEALIMAIQKAKK
ncbi:hypothetical protein [Enterobacter sp. RIT418]|uniref:hypothetical protein n=1 Tax=Enterobacter sp. RIT418 TaxID=2202164 RepID=UPI000D42B7BF|nr:hypothetical protein [Enterobacter sp. RIT 418]RAU36577.1 hypothetical protein DBY73_008990 [Enterobacter sp. RIT 418]